MASLIQWVDRLMRSGVQPSPQVHAWYIWALCDSLQYERARHALDDLDRRVAEEPGCASDELRERLLFLRMMVGVFTDRLDEVLAQAMAWLGRSVAADALTVAAITTFAAIGELHLGNLNTARLLMERARATIDRSDSAYGLAWVCIISACVEIGQARPAAADELIRAGRARVANVIGSDAGVVVTLDFVHARALLDLGETAQARALALRGLGRAAGHGILTSLEQGLSACVDLWDGPDDPALPESLFIRVACGYPSRAAALLAAAKVRRLLALKRPTDANAEAARFGMWGSTATQEHGDLALAPLELLLAQGACNTVLPRAEEWLKRAQQQGRERERVELHLVACEAHRRLNNEPRARRHLALAISIAAPGGLMHPFKANSLMLASLDESTFGFVRKVERDFLQRLRAWLRSDAPAAAPVSVAAGALSIRELQVLSLLDEGLGNEQVADRLELSVQTVKWHLHNAYCKLGVRSRSAALARARALKLLGR
jgi:ATP/maltotriose-dependent transcriptional regulator MalT